MSGFNWATSPSSVGSSTVLSPAGDNARISAPWESSGYSLRDINNRDIKDTWQNVANFNMNNAMYAYNKSYQSFLENRDYNYNLYKENRDFNAMMNNTSISRMMEDMKRAGINPILAGRYGGFNWSNINAPFDYSTPYFNAPVMNMPQLDTNNYYGQDSQYFSAMLDADTKMKLQDKQFQHDFEMLTKSTMKDLEKLHYEYQEKSNYMIKQYDTEYGYKFDYQHNEQEHNKIIQQNQMSWEYELEKYKNKYNRDLQILLKEMDVNQRDRNTFANSATDIIETGARAGQFAYSAWQWSQYFGY